MSIKLMAVAGKLFKIQKMEQTRFCEGKEPQKTSRALFSKRIRNVVKRPIRCVVRRFVNVSAALVELVCTQVMYRSR